MQPFVDLAYGFAAAVTPTHLMMCFAGVLLGQIVGILPGIGPSAAIALLLPLTFGADPTAAILSVALLLDHVGLDDAARRVEQAVVADLAERAELAGGPRRTTEIGDAIAARVFG